MRQRRAAAAYGQATGDDGVGRTCGVGGCCFSWWRAAMEGSVLGGWLFSRRHTCTPLHSSVSQTLPFARHWTNTLHLRLSDSLQISRYMRSGDAALCIARAWHWMDYPLEAVTRGGGEAGAASRVAPCTAKTCAVESSSFLVLGVS